MNVKLVSEKRFTLEVGGEKFEGMRLVSSWEGFEKYEGDHGLMAVVWRKSSLASGLFEVFGISDELAIVVASPIIVKALERSKPVGTPTLPSVTLSQLRQAHAVCHGDVFTLSVLEALFENARGFAS